MSMANVFSSDAFSVVSLTDAILKAPYKPGRIGMMGLFRERGISTTTAIIEEKDGRLSLLQTSPRGAPPNALGPNSRRARALLVPHIQLESNILADEVQNIRAFGSENQVAGVQAVVNERLVEMRANVEVTLEYQRIGAIKGLILDADGSTLFDLFTEFGVSQQTYGFDPAADVRAQAVDIARLIEDELGAEPVSGLRAFCGAHFFDRLIAAAPVVTSLQYQESAQLRGDLRAGFQYGGITWEEYRGSVGGVAFIPDGEAYVFPEASNIFKTYFAPADFMETVNTPGLPIYAKQVADDELNRWVRLHVQSNPLSINVRPRTVVKVSIAS